MATLEEKLRESFKSRFYGSKKLSALGKIIDSGISTYDEANEFAIATGEILAKTLRDVDLSRLTSNELIELTENLFPQFLRQNYDLIERICLITQENLYSAADIGLRALEPGFDYSRASGLGNVYRDEVASGVLGNKFLEQIVNFSQSVVDSSVRLNADFDAEAGLKPIIKRDYEGKHWDPHRGKHGIFVDCEYCRNLAGKWSYGNEPRDVYKRHDSCRCKVQYFPNEKAEGRITALSKGQKDTGRVLWNTGQTLSVSRKAELRRERDSSQNEMKKILNATWKAATT